MSARPEWPKTEPSAATLLDHLAGLGLWCSAAIWPAMAARDLAAADQLMHQTTTVHDAYLLLDALNEIDPDKADQLAARIWHAAEAGDSYGEWLYQWAEERGLDAAAISEEGNSWAPK